MKQRKGIILAGGSVLDYTPNFWFIKATAACL